MSRSKSSWLCIRKADLKDSSIFCVPWAMTCVRIVYPLHTARTSKRKSENCHSQSPRDSRMRESSTLRIRVMWIHSLTSPFSLFPLSYLVLKLHDTLVSPKYFHLAICSPFLFQPSKVLKNVFILLMYTHNNSRIICWFPAQSKLCSTESLSLSKCFVFTLAPLLSTLPLYSSLHHY
jgi:hypothetical protein